MAEINDSFLDQKIEFAGLNKKTAIRTNFSLFSKNWEDLEKYIANLMLYLKYLRGLIDIDNIIKTITEKFQSSKLTIPIESNLAVGASKNVLIDSTTYKVNRVAQFVVEITNLTTPEWVVDKLIVQVKDLDGTIVYPTISTKNSKITIHFIDGILTNYYLIVI